MTLSEALETGVAPWDPTNIICKLPEVWIYQDAFPVTDGHLLFVPLTDTTDGIASAFEVAINFHSSNASANIGINLGVSAGQTVMYPHIHYIPRTPCDTENPRGGIRNVIPGKGDYTTL